VRSPDHSSSEDAHAESPIAKSNETSNPHTNLMNK
jgi:hypothetical protein